MDTFALRVVASDKVFYEGRAKFLVLPEPDGEKAVQIHHEDMISAVVPGEIRFQTKEGEWIKAAISGGIAQVINNRVLILVLSAEHPEEIDLRRAEEAKERAEEKLRQHKSQQEYLESKMALARAMTRLKVGTKGNIK